MSLEASSCTKLQLVAYKHSREREGGREREREVCPLSAVWLEKGRGTNSSDICTALTLCAGFR
jgi:hypothetical protein